MNVWGEGFHPLILFPVWAAAEGERRVWDSLPAPSAALPHFHARRDRARSGEEREPERFVQPLPQPKPPFGNNPQWDLPGKPGRALARPGWEAESADSRPANAGGLGDRQEGPKTRAARAKPFLDKREGPPAKAGADSEPTSDGIQAGELSLRWPAVLARGVPGQAGQVIAVATKNFQTARLGFFQ